MTEDDIRRIVREELTRANRIDVTAILNAANANAKAGAIRACTIAYDRRNQLGQ